MCERHAGVHFHARVSTLASTCLRAAVAAYARRRVYGAQHGSRTADDITTDLKTELVCKLLSLFVETYGMERGSGTADDIMNDLKKKLLSLFAETS